MEEFKVGDIVKLKCCPQVMMVQSFPGTGTDARNHAECVWIDDFGTPHREVYVFAVLEPKPDGDKIPEM